jgi:hypothetical protein
MIAFQSSTASALADAASNTAAAAAHTISRDIDSSRFSSCFVPNSSLAELPRPLL